MLFHYYIAIDHVCVFRYVVSMHYEESVGITPEFEIVCRCLKSLGVSLPRTPIFPVHLNILLSLFDTTEGSND